MNSWHRTGASGLFGTDTSERPGMGAGRGSARGLGGRAACAPWGLTKVDALFLVGPGEISEPCLALLCNCEGVGALSAMPTGGRSGTFLEEAWGGGLKG